MDTLRRIPVRGKTICVRLRSVGSHYYCYCANLNSTIMLVQNVPSGRIQRRKSEVMTANILDTQVISYAFKKVNLEDVQNATIPSITANEFLLTQSKLYNKAQYYIPLPNKLAVNVEDEAIPLPRRDHAFRKEHTDYIVLDFQNEYPSIILFNNLSISEVINRKLRSLFRSSISFLDKKQQKIIQSRFSFLIEHDIKCLPVTRNIIPIGLELLSDFTIKHNPKEDFRNTVNDILIFTIALKSGMTLITKDNLLNRFAADYFEAHSKIKDNLLEVTFAQRITKEQRNNHESKGYINRGWHYKLRNYRNQANKLT